MNELNNRELTNKDICDVFDLPTVLSTNIVEEKITKNKVQAALKIIAKTLAKTLGPWGQTTICQQQSTAHLITKDGYDVINRMQFMDDVSNTVLDIVRQISAAQVSQVGDGSTSAIIVAEALYSELANMKGVSQKDVISILKIYEDEIVEMVKNFAKPVENMDVIGDVASISLNNNDDTGELIRDIYDVVGPDGFIITEFDQPIREDKVEYKKGIEFYRGYIDKCFAQKENSVVYEADGESDNPLVFVLNMHLSYEHVRYILEPILLKYCGHMRKKVLIVVNSYTPDVHLVFRNNRLLHKLKKDALEMDFTVVDIDNVSDRSYHDIIDISKMAGCEVYDPLDDPPENFADNIEMYVGSVEKIIVTDTSTRIIASDNLEKDKKDLLETHIKQLQDEYIEKDKGEEMISPIEAFEYRRRISNMTSGTAIIHVAGELLVERVTRERLFEDAILSAKSALKNGVVPGGNLIIPYLLTDGEISKISNKICEKYSYLSHDIVDNIGKMLKKALMNSFLNVILNTEIDFDDAKNIVDCCVDEGKIFNLKTRKFETFDETKIINSSMTDIQILRSVISIIGTLGTSYQFIVLRPDLDSVAYSRRQV